MLFEIHAINKDELGLQVLHFGFGGWVHRIGLDFGEFCATQAGKIFGNIEDVYYKEAEAAQGL
jgi:uncharacterized protein YrrD